jgi:mannose-6-phosphate isomerase-like protein (cupin superfamily)
MIIKKDDRAKSLRPKLKDGQGVINIFDLTTDESRPEKLRLCSEFVLKPDESIGSHAHIGETEIYYVLSGEGSVLDNGEFRKLHPGDTAITDGESPHSIKNDGYEELRFIGIIVLD